jgi:hypothetical protein
MMFIPKSRIEACAADLWSRHGLAPGFDVERLLVSRDPVCFTWR